MTTPLKNIFVSALVALIMMMLPLAGFSQFVANNGQIAHREIAKMRPDIKFQLSGGNVLSNFRNDGVENYYYKIRETPRENWSEELLTDERMGRKLHIPKDIFFFRFDIEFVGANPSAQIIPEDQSESYRNYYYEFCPNGILNVPEYKTIIYKDLYPKIDLKYNCKAGIVKYEFILHKGAKVSDIRMQIEGVEDLQVDQEGNLSYIVAGEKMIEKAPYSFYTENNQELVSHYKVNEESIVTFDIPGQQLIDEAITIDPVLTWSTYFQGAYGGYQGDPGVDNSGNIYICTQEGAGTLPVLNAGGGQWYQGTTTGISPNWDLAIFKFNSSLALSWCTFYGGMGCEQGWGKRNVAIDNTNNIIYFSGETDTPYGNSVQTFPTQDPGGGAFYQSVAFDNGAANPFFIAFNPSGVRQWATMFTYETAPYSGGMGTDIEAIYFRNGYLYFAGETNKYSHSGIPLRTLTGGYNNSYWPGDGTYPFCGRFSTSYVLNWCTYINNNVATTSFSANVADMVVDASNNMYVVTDYSEYSAGKLSTILPLVNPGGGAYYVATGGLGYGSRRGTHITKLNPANSSVLWGTFHSGGYGDLPGTAEIDASNNLYIGYRSVGSTDFPVLNPGGGAYYQATKRSVCLTGPNDYANGGKDGAIAKFASTGVRIWSTYINGTNPTSGETGVNDIDAYPTNEIMMSSKTVCPDFPVQNLAGSYYKATLTTAGTYENIFTKFSSAGVIQWGTYFQPLMGYGAIQNNACYSKYIVDNGGSLTGAVPLVNPGGTAYYSAVGQNYQSFQLFEDATSNQSTQATSASASASPVCSGGATTLSITGGTLGLGASWQWYSTSCGVGSVGSGASIVVNPTSTTTYWVRAEGTCNMTPCVSVTVTVNPNASITSVTGSSPICIGATTNYSANGVVLSGGTGAWSSSNSGIASVNGSGVVTGVSGGTCNIIYTITGGCGGTVSAQQAITITPNASIASVTGTSPLCIGATAGYSANSVVLGGGTGAWSSGNSGIASVSAGGTVSGVAAGTTNIIYTITGGCNGTPSAQQSVTINPNASIASVTGTSPLCIGATAGYSANSVVLGGGTGAWSSGNSGTASVSAGGTVTGVAAGTTNIIYTITGGCNGTPSAQQSVTVNPNASIASVTGTSPLCIGATAGYSANSVVLGGGTGAWSSGNSGTASVSAGGTVTGVAAGTTNIIYTITGGCNGTPSAQQSVTVNPNASIASVTGTSPLCIGATAGYSANSVVLGGGTGAWSSGNSGTASVSAGGTVTGVAAGTTNIIYTITGGCNGTPSAQQSVTVNPNASIASVTGTSPLCIGATAGYSANSVVLGGGTGAWSSGNSGTASVTAGGTVTGVAAGTTNIIYTITGGCNGTPSAQQSVTVNPNASIASVTGSTPLCIGANTGYTANSVVLGGGVGTWSSSASGTASVNGSGTVTGVTAGSCNIIYTITGGCNGTPSAQQSITITPNASIASVTGSSPICPGATTNYAANSIVLGGGTGAWSSSNSGIASVNGSGVVTGVSAGSCNIIYTITGGCGGTTSAQQLITVSPAAPATPGAITGSITVCPNSSGLIYSISNVTNATTYNWTVPAGWSINAGGGSNTISVTSGSTGQNGTITVTAQNSCGTSLSSSINVSVTTVVAASVGISVSANPVCAGTSVTFTASPTNGGGTPSYQWYLNGSPIGSNSNTYTSSALTNLNQVYCIMTSSEACATGSPSTSNTIIMNIDALSVAPASINTSVNPICQGSSSLLTVQGGTLGAGASWMWYSGSCGTTYEGTGASITVNPSGNTDYFVLAQGSCNTTLCANVTVSVTAVAAVASGDQTICTGDSVQISVTGTGSYSWTPGGQSAAAFYVTPGGTTTYTVTSTNGSCTASDAVTVNVTGAADASITATGPYCTGQSPLLLTSVDPGGTWTGTGITNAATGLFAPAVAGAGSHAIIYTISGSCGDADTVNLSVGTSVDATISAAGPYCSDASAVTLNAATAGGTWSGAGITNTSTGLFNPAVSGSGSFDIIYAISGLCGDADTLTIVVNPAPNATVTPAGPYCLGDAAVTLNAASVGGTWSGTGITNTTNGTFDPATAGIGTHLITYIIPGSCADTSSISIVVNGVMDATITPAGPFCSNDTPVNLVAAMAGGSWAGPGITNATTGLFNPSISGSGSFNIIYAIAGSCGDADTVTIVVNPAHNASINPSGPYCETDSPVFLSSFENGGVWTGTGITNAATGSFDPALAGAGSHQIIYSIAGTCGDADTITITVTALANTSITSTGPYCNNIGVFDLTAATTGGIWSGAGITNTSTGTFNPIFAGVGTHTIIYLITGACGNSDTVSLTVLPSPTANAVGADESCIGKMDGSAVVTGTGGTAPYTYLWETSATTPDISGMAPGEYAVVVSDASGCFAADTALILGATTPCEIIVPVVYIPNIFTPNGDGSNDVLYVRGQGITTFTLSIYDRWGEMVFETSELTYGWDGTFHNKHMDAGVFVWQLHVEFIDGTVKNDKGNLTMTR